MFGWMNECGRERVSSYSLNSI